MNDLMINFVYKFVIHKIRCAVYYVMQGYFSDASYLSSLEYSDLTAYKLKNDLRYSFGINV